MNIKAFRQDLAQKSQEAKKTHFSEDKINVTFSGIKAEADLERYKALAEALQIKVEDLVQGIRETYMPKKRNIRLGSAEDRRRIEEAGKKPREPKKDPAKDEKYPSKKIEESVRKVVDVLEAADYGSETLEMARNLRNRMNSK